MRPDGIRVKGADPMYSLMPYFLTKRYDAMNMVTLDIPVAPLKEYINVQRAKGVKLSHLALILAAYVRTAAEFPALNRFIVRGHGRHPAGPGGQHLRQAEIPPGG